METDGNAPHVSAEEEANGHASESSSSSFSSSSKDLKPKEKKPSKNQFNMIVIGNVVVFVFFFFAVDGFFLFFLVCFLLSEDLPSPSRILFIFLSLSPFVPLRICLADPISPLLLCPDSLIFLLHFSCRCLTSWSTFSY